MEILPFGIFFWNGKLIYWKTTYKIESVHKKISNQHLCDFFLENNLIFQFGRITDEKTTEKNFFPSQARFLFRVQRWNKLEWNYFRNQWASISHLSRFGKYFHAINRPLINDSQSKAKSIRCRVAGPQSWTRHWRSELNSNINLFLKSLPFNWNILWSCPVKPF